MTWVLILTLTISGQVTTVPAAVMGDARMCNIAGAGMKAVLEAANPGVVVGWTCRARAVAA